MAPLFLTPFVVVTIVALIVVGEICKRNGIVKRRKVDKYANHMDDLRKEMEM